MTKERKRPRKKLHLIKSQKLSFLAFQRSIRLQKVMALSKSTEAGNKEFVVHVKGEYDYRFICEMRDDMFEQIKACYFHLMNENLPVFGVPGKLK